MRRKRSGLLSDSVVLDLLVFARAESSFDAPTVGMEWDDYERACADALQKEGFEVTMTKSVGDFGADILVTKDDLSYVVQCKWHGRPIGLKAVQEVHSSRGMYQADYAAVVSESEFTYAARELAHANRVALLSLARLPSLEREFL